MLDCSNIYLALPLHARQRTYVRASRAHAGLHALHTASAHSARITHLHARVHICCAQTLCATIFSCSLYSIYRFGCGCACVGANAIRYIAARARIKVPGALMTPRDAYMLSADMMASPHMRACGRRTLVPYAACCEARVAIRERMERNVSTLSPHCQHTISTPAIDQHACASMHTPYTSFLAYIHASLHALHIHRIHACWHAHLLT
jgi:hypothetical protein